MNFKKRVTGPFYYTVKIQQGLYGQRLMVVPILSWMADRGETLQDSLSCKGIRNQQRLGRVTDR